ncbi:MAG TPA: penicillin-binding protein 2, partial [Candidatus Acidoferrum sp.]|nr:penicillin-binding protein 2 [Candidatus Acidoferrum sp.]
MDRYTLSPQSREKIAHGMVTGALILLVVGLIKLQIVEHRNLAELADNNRIRVVPLEPQRGFMYDREGKVIVGNRPSYTVSVVPSEVVKGKTIRNLAKLIGFDSTEVRNRIRKNLASPYQPADVKRDIQFDVIAVLEEQNTEYPGVNYQLDQVRQYGVELGAESFTGHVGEVSESEMDKAPKGEYRMGSIIGKKGLEKEFDRLLRGIEGTAYIEVSALGEVLGPYEGRQKVEPKAGSDLVLSIDNDVQKVAVAQLDSFCCGAIVAMDPRNGEIIAMTSDPGFDANTFSSFVSDSLWQAIANDSTHPLLNRPLNGVYPPGSTAKLLTLGAGLQEGVIDENSTFRSCGGGFQYGNRYFKCWDKRGHGALTAVHAVEASCDVYFYQLGLKLGVDQLSRYYDLCGFGKPTGIDLPNESSGLNPNSKYYDRRYGKNGWTRALSLNNAIGQGEILVTPLQLTQFYAGIANWGTVYRPHIVRAIRGPNGDETEVKPEVSFKLPFDNRVLGFMREGVRLVVEGGRGTARRLKNNYYSIAGKTGTAQNPHGKDHSWFVGYAPIENPEIVCCAIVENAGHGSE